MPFTTELLRRAAAHVTEVLPRSIPSWVRYHSLDHTLDTVRAAEDLGSAEHLSPSDMEALLLAAWFHDIGYTRTVEGHEAESARAAHAYLAPAGAATTLIGSVERAILATRMPQQPSCMLEAVLCDADVAHIGDVRFFERSNLLREEIALRTGSGMGDVQWLTLNLDFVTRHTFHTQAARERFGVQRGRNLEILRERLRELSGKGTPSWQ